MRTVTALAVLTSSVALLTACGASSNAKYPPRKEGCEVKMFVEAPTLQTENIGPVTSSCDADVSDAECLRALQDEVCRLGGDVVWGVEPTPRLELGKKKFSGRAAHSKAAAPAP